MKSKGTENGGKPLWARKASWVPHFFRPTCFNGSDSVMSEIKASEGNEMVNGDYWIYSDGNGQTIQARCEGAAC